MAAKDDSSKKSTRSEELFFTGLAKRRESPLNNRVWKYLLLTAAGCLLAWILVRVIPARTGPLKFLVLAAVSLATWALAVRLLFIETKARAFWVIWLVIGLIPLASMGNSPHAWLPPTFFSFIFLFFRKYRPYGHLASRRQAVLFGVGLVLLVLLLFFYPSHPSSSGPVTTTTLGSVLTVQAVQPQLPTNRAVLLNNILRFSLVSLRWFWFFSLFHLLVTVRLHFMKLKPKLAVAAVFLVIVPIVLLVALGAGTLYITLGQSHAAGARSYLEEWERLAALDADFVRTLSPAWFTAEVAGGEVRSAGRPPNWLPVLAAGLGVPGSPFDSKASTAGLLFGRSDGVWILGLSRSLSGVVSINGCPIDAAAVSRLAGTVHSDVVVGLNNPLSFMLSDSKVRETDLSREDLIRIRGETLEIRGVYQPLPSGSVSTQAGPAAPPSFLQRRIFFGITELDMVMLEKGLWIKGSLILQTPRSLGTTLTELFAVSSPMGTVVMATLILLGFLFLVLETLALIFGLRISGGITKSIRTMHRHLCCVAAGDLDGHIDIPNQDELGDLAASFNQMTAAVKQGREEAIARERLEKELETARLIQERLLPHKMPVFAGFEVSGLSLPSHEVGGDYFDFLDLETGHLGVAIADVSGKGIPAALLMANLQASLHAQDLRPESVSVIVSRLNGILVKNTDERMFVTFFYGILDKMKATFTYTNAGHNPPILLRAGGKVDRLEEGGMLLGFLSDQSYSQASVSLEPGDVLVLFTDGITEAMNPEAESREGKYFGEENFIDVLKANAGRSAADIQAAVLAAITHHTRQAPQSDDITLVIIKRTGGREALAYVS